MILITLEVTILGTVFLSETLSHGEREVLAQKIAGLEVNTTDQFELYS